MCGRFALNDSWGSIEKRFTVSNRLQLFSPHFNVAPGMMMPIIRRETQNVAVLAKWGLVPFWAKDPKIGYKMINARAETLTEKSSFRKPFISGRCLVPASGFYEWKHLDREKVPFYIKLKNQDLFSFAGLFDTWHDVENRQLLTFTIITTEPNAMMAEIHNRMPVILPPEAEKDWLNPETKDPVKLTEMLKSYDQKFMTAYPVSSQVNSPENDTPDLIKPQEQLHL